MVELIGRLHREAALTVITVTHDLNALAVASERVLALAGGRIVFDGPPAALLEPPVLEEVFGSRFVRVPRSDSALPVVVPTAGRP